MCLRTDKRGAVPPLNLARTLAAVVPRLALGNTSAGVCELHLANRQTRQVQCLAPFIELTVENNRHGGGVVVSALGEGSASEEGILVGDVVLAVNEKPVNDHAAAIALVHAAVGPFVTLTLVDGTSRHLLDKSQGDLGITCVARPVHATPRPMQQAIYTTPFEHAHTKSTARTQRTPRTQRAQPRPTHRPPCHPESSSLAVCSCTNCADGPGALITHVSPSGVAAAAGLVEGRVIL